jgi:hypothetical protein
MTTLLSFGPYELILVFVIGVLPVILIVGLIVWLVKKNRKDQGTV